MGSGHPVIKTMGLHRPQQSANSSLSNSYSFRSSQAVKVGKKSGCDKYRAMANLSWPVSLGHRLRLLNVPHRFSRTKRTIVWDHPHFYGNLKGHPCGSPGLMWNACPTFAGGWQACNIWSVRRSWMKKGFPYGRAIRASLITKGSYLVTPTPPICLTVSLLSTCPSKWFTCGISFQFS